MKRVGVIGGMGPEATVLLMQRVIRVVPAADDADHVPLLVHQNPQIPSRIAALIEGTGESPVPAMVQMARELQGAGCAALAMPCNTAHAYADAIAAAVDVPLLHMVQITADALAARLGRGAPVGMLASPAVRLAGVYAAPFERAGLRAIYLPDDTALLGLIRRIKAEGPTEELTGRIGSFARALRDAGAGHLLVACTELSLVSAGLAEMAFSDSLDLLVAEIVRFARGG